MARRIRDRNRIFIIAGPNGTGKTTFAHTYLPQVGCTDFINADYIAHGLSPFAPERAAIAAGKIMLDQIAERVKRQASFALETTLSGRTYISRITQWRKLGYRVTLIFIRLPAVELSLARVAARVAQGGHNIPESVIRRRFDLGWKNFTDIYSKIVDEWMLFDGMASPPIEIDRGVNP